MVGKKILDMSSSYKGWGKNFTPEPLRGRVRCVVPFERKNTEIFGTFLC